MEMPLIPLVRKFFDVETMEKRKTNMWQWLQFHHARLTAQACGYVLMLLSSQAFTAMACRAIYIAWLIVFYDENCVLCLKIILFGRD